MSAVIELAGRRFGRLTVLTRAAPNPALKTQQSLWLCTCACGKQCIVRSQDLRNDRVRSCGCFRSEVAAATCIARQTTHGHASKQGRSPTYFTWAAMRARCRNPNDKDFDEYGGRGITICDRWLESFEAFLTDMGARPAGTTIDRIDNERGYEPSNYRWATAVVQQRNQRRTILGEVAVCLIRTLRRRQASVADLAYAFGISEATVSDVVHGRTWAT